MSARTLHLTVAQYDTMVQRGAFDNLLAEIPDEIKSKVIEALK